jgi:hypothetical protein
MQMRTGTLNETQTETFLVIEYLLFIVFPAYPRRCGGAASHTVERLIELQPEIPVEILEGAA